jgi:hypothetical protein
MLWLLEITIYNFVLHANCLCGNETSSLCVVQFIQKMG